MRQAFRRIQVRVSTVSGALNHDSQIHNRLFAYDTYDRVFPVTDSLLSTRSTVYYRSHQSW